VTGLALLLVLAQVVPAGPRPRVAGPSAEAGAPRDEAFKMIDAYVVSNLQESLQLSDEQFVKVLPLVRRLQTDRRAMMLRRAQPLAELRRELASGTATEPRVTELLGQIKAAEAEEPAVLRKDREALDAALSPVQQAKFRVMELDVERKIRELMNQVRAGRGAAAQRRRQDAPPEP
jgi:hypothetical protein